MSVNRVACNEAPVGGVTSQVALNSRSFDVPPVPSCPPGPDRTASQAANGPVPYGRSRWTARACAAPEPATVLPAAMAHSGEVLAQRQVADKSNEIEDVPGQAGLDGAVSAGRGQVMGAAWKCAAEPQGCAVRAGDDLHVHPVMLVFLAVVRLVRGDPVGRDEDAVNNDEVPFTQPDEGFLQARSPGGENLDDLVDVAPGQSEFLPRTELRMKEAHLRSKVKTRADSREVDVNFRRH